MNPESTIPYFHFIKKRTEAKRDRRIDRSTSFYDK